MVGNGPGPSLESPSVTDVSSDRIAHRLQEITGAVVRRDGREAIERTLCETLVDSGLYEYAWLGERAFDGETMVLRVDAGDCRDSGGNSTAAGLPGRDGLGVAGRVYDSGELTVSTAATADRRRNAGTHVGTGQFAAVPLQRGAVVSGVLLLYTGRNDAFGADERSGLEVLGETTGLAIQAARSRKLLYADSAVELAFCIGRTDSVLVRLGSELDRSFSLAGYVPSDDHWVLYLDVGRPVSGSALEAVEGDPRVQRLRLVEGDDRGDRVELELSATSLPGTAIDAGATITNVEVGYGESRLVVEAAADEDVRGIVTRIRERYPEADLLARRERDVGLSTGPSEEGILGTLTDRQQESLEAAYRAGYFEWPRENTAEDVSETLGLAAPTLHGHLRKAQRSILSALLDSEE